MIEHMFDNDWITDLDAEGACEAIGRNQDELREREWLEISLAAHWAVLRGVRVRGARVADGDGVHLREQPDERRTGPAAPPSADVGSPAGR